VLDSSRNNAQLRFVIQETIDVTIEAQPTEGVLACLGVVIPVLPEHRVSFARAGLAVSENRRIEPSRYVEDAV